VITAILDDDPTGTQAMSAVSVILDWDDPEAWQAVEPEDRAVHLLTNSRAYDASEAAALVRAAAGAARARYPACRLLLRGDSTLRAHVWEEYEALRSIVAAGRRDVPLLLVPALPAAGRITVNGVHLLERDGERTPLDRTEYARDGSLAYHSSELARWAEERSCGRFAARDAARVSLEALRGQNGAEELRQAIATAASAGHAAVVVPDAENEHDLDLVADGLRRAEAERTVIVRCAPPFVAALTGAAASDPPAAPRADRGVLLMCGSFVPTTTAQLERLERTYPGSTVQVRAAALVGSDSGVEVARAAEAATERLESDGLACVTTERVRDMTLLDPESQRRVALSLAQVARRIDVGVVIAKGGITSAVTAREGLGARAARVLGPIRPGVALWKLADGRDYLVVPGNVGGPELLVDLVGAILANTGRC
jgi:uncharacterized protein YgbK (DUF1537 family)